jgi:phosphatidylglycerophosphate synthase
LPEWALPLLLLIVSREFLITGLRLVAASSGIVLGAEKSGKHKTVSQIISAILLLLAIALQADWQSLCSPQIAEWILRAGILFFIIATGLTVTSGTRYMIKYWAVFTGQNESKSQ